MSEITISIDRDTIWLLRERYGKRKGVKTLVKLAMAEVVRDQAQKTMNEKGYAPVELAQLQA